VTRWALIDEQSGIVVNMILHDGGTEVLVSPEGYILVMDESVKAGPGFRLVDGEFVPPPSCELKETLDDGQISLLFGDLARSVEQTRARKKQSG
jgi:hypothetical protein